MRLYIKNMVCDRCRLVVKRVFEDIGISIKQLELGEVDLLEPISINKKLELEKLLFEYGFELIDDKKTKIIQQTKSFIIDKVRNAGSNDIKLSEALTANLHLDYTYLSNLFSAVEGRSIEHFMISQRIERAKELLVYDELSLTQIADELGYSSVAYLSNQFKTVTGLTPTKFKGLRNKNRQGLDKL